MNYAGEYYCVIIEWGLGYSNGSVQDLSGFSTRYLFVAGEAKNSYVFRKLEHLEPEEGDISCKLI